MSIDGVIGSILHAIFLLGFLVGIVWFLHYPYTVWLCRSVIERWATGNGFEIVSIRRPHHFRTGPYGYWERHRKAAFVVEYYESNGSETKVWLLCSTTAFFAKVSDVKDYETLKPKY